MLLLSACATTSTGELAERDPLEGLNRSFYDMNRAFDIVLIKPISTVYRAIIPRPARRGVARAFSNLSEPWSFVNNLLQAKPKRAVRNLGRFVVNTTIGVGGLADHATGMGIKPAPEDFGQTLAVWGVKDSPYLVLPILGPSTIRDGIGSGVGFLADPVGVCLRENGCINATNTERLGINAAEIISVRADLTEAGADTLLEGSLDPYTTMRSAYLQRRRAAIADEDQAAAAITPVGGTGTGTGDPALDAAVRDLEEQGADESAEPPTMPSPTAPQPADTPSVASEPPR